MANLAQRSFTAGELAPALYARTDLTKYATGLRTCRNCIIHRYGGVSNRAGTQYVGSTKANGAVRLVRFEFSNEQTYLLEFGDRYVRFYTDAARIVVESADAWANGTAYTTGDLVAQSGAFYYCKQDHTAATATDKPGSGTLWAGTWYALTMDGSDGIYEIPTPYAAGDVARFQTLQDGDVLSLVHPDYAPRQLERHDHTRWILTQLAFGPSVDAVENVAATGGAAGTDTYYAVTAVSEALGDEGLPGLTTLSAKVPSSANPVTLTWDPTSGARAYNVYRSLDGQTYGWLALIGGLPVLQSTTTWTNNTDSASTASTGTWVAATTGANLDPVATASDRAIDGKYRIRGKLTLTLTAFGDASARLRAYYKRDSETRVDAGVVASVDVAGGTYNETTFDIAVMVPDTGYTALTLYLVPEVMGVVGPATFTAVVDETTAPNNEVTWTAPALGYTDIGSDPQFDITPPFSPHVFAAIGEFPQAVGTFQQRRLYGGATDTPAQLRASRTAVPDSFTESTPAQDDDAFAVALSTWIRTEIRHLRDLGRLVVFATSGEWIIEGDNTNILKPGAINARQFSAFGSAYLSPIQVGAGTLFLQARQTIVRDLSIDTVQGVSSQDISVFAAHLFEGYTIIDWDFAQIPHGIVWAVRSDGTMLGLTYLPEQQVWGWHRHDTDGVIENVCVVPEDDEDRVYLVVNRTIDGSSVRYVERMTSRVITDLTDQRDLIFVDAALSYDGRNTGATTITVSGGTNWDNEETLTLTTSAAFFTAGMVGGAIVVFDADGVELFRVALEAYTSTTVMTGHPDKEIPSAYRSVATTSWGHAAITFTGLDHLEGKSVSVFADAAVAASPDNPDYADVTVTSGSITLATPAVRVHVGLPYRSDLETLDIDTAQGPSLKPKKQLISSVLVLVDQSRPFWVGPKPPADDDSDPIDGLDLNMPRDVDNDYGPLDLRRGDFEVTISNRWNSNGRVFLRQTDPVPMTVLAVIPQGMVPPTN